MSEQETTPAPGATNSTPKKKGGCVKVGLWAFGILVALAVIGGIVGKDGTARRSTSGGAASAASDSRSTNEPIRSSTQIGISRSSIMGHFSGDGYRFERGADIDGKPNYLGRSSRYKYGSIQLIGDAENLSSAAYLAVLSLQEGDGVDNAPTGEELGKLLRFLSGGPEPAEWFSSEMKNANLLDDWKADRYFGGLHYRLSYTYMGQSAIMTMTVEPS
jgi:hypothetical protein